MSDPGKITARCSYCEWSEHSRDFDLVASKLIAHHEKKHPGEHNPLAMARPDLVQKVTGR